MSNPIVYNKKATLAWKAEQNRLESARRAALSHDEAVAEAREAVHVEEGDLVVMWDDFELGTTRLATLDEFADYYRSSSLG